MLFAFNTYLQAKKNSRCWGRKYDFFIVFGAGNRVVKSVFPESALLPRYLTKLDLRGSVTIKRISRVLLIGQSFSTYQWKA